MVETDVHFATDINLLLDATRKVIVISADLPSTYNTPGWRQIDQVDRRVLQEERIPHKEKVFSLFEPHTEWISKGKAGVPVELGLRVCIMADQHRFILHHRVMEKITDDKVAFVMVGETKQKFRTLRAVSMDKGFYSPANLKILQSRLECVELPKKGKLSQADKVREDEVEFVDLRKQHSAVEKCINITPINKEPVWQTDKKLLEWLKSLE